MLSIQARLLSQDAVCASVGSTCGADCWPVSQLLLRTVASCQQLAGGRPVHWVMAKQVPAVLQGGSLSGSPPKLTQSCMHICSAVSCQTFPAGAASAVASAQRDRQAAAGTHLQGSRRIGSCGCPAPATWTSQCGGTPALTRSWTENPAETLGTGPAPVQLGSRRDGRAGAAQVGWTAAVRPGLAATGACCWPSRAAGLQDEREHIFTCALCATGGADIGLCMLG